MKPKIKQICLFFSLFIVLGLDGQASSEPVHVVVSVGPLKSMATHLGAGHLEVTQLVPNNTTPHVFGPKPSHVKAIKQARQLVLIGWGLEHHWVDKLVKSAGNPNLQIISLERGISPIGGAHPNPHIWVSPQSLQSMAHHMHNAFVQILPDHQDTLAHRKQYVDKQIEDLIQRFKTELSHVKDRRIISTRPAFAYLVRDFGIQEEDIIAGSHGHEPSPKKLARIIQKIKKEKIPVLLDIAQAHDQFISSIVDETNITLVKWDLFGKNEQDYFTLMNANLDKLIAGFQKP